MTINSEKRKAWESRISSKLDELDAEFKKLKAQGHDTAGEAKQKHEEKMEKVKKHRDRARTKLEEVREAGEDSWEKVREGSEKAWEDFSSAVAGAKDALSKK
jgi:hypothetical protein